MFDGANILVAGGTGFVGVNLILRLLSLEANVRATIHRKRPVILDERIEYVRCDLTRAEDCTKVVRDMDYVFLCAANTSGAAVMKSTPLVHVTPNLLMNSQLLEAAYFAGIEKFVWISSSAAYPPSEGRPIKEDELLVGDPYESYFAVGWMKRYTEVLCRMYSEKLKDPMPTVVLRPSNMYGPYDDFEFETSHMTAALIRRVVERHNPLLVWGTGEDVRDLIYIDDFIDAMLLAVEKINSYDPVNIALGKGYSVKQVLQMLIEIDNYTDAKIEFDTSKPSTIPTRLIDTTKAQKVLGFRAKTDLREGLEKTVRWYRKVNSSYDQRVNDTLSVRDRLTPDVYIRLLSTMELQQNGSFEVYESKRVSFVMTTKNRAEALDRALALSREYVKPEDELIIIDGHSTDHALSAIGRYADLADIFVSEPDKSAAHAFNKGIMLARGKYIKNIADDDVLHPEAMEEAIQVLEKHPEVDVLICGGTVQRGESCKTVCLPPGTNYGKSVEDVFTYGAKGVGFILRRSALSKIGLCNPIAPLADHEFILQAISRGANVKFCRINLYHHPILEHSHARRLGKQMKIDSLRLRKQYCSTGSYYRYRIRYLRRQYLIFRLLIWPFHIIKLFQKKSSRLIRRFSLSLRTQDNAQNLSDNVEYTWDGGFS